MSATPQSPPLLPVPKLPKSQKRKVTPKKWQEIETAWKDGEYATIADLSEHFKVSESEIRQRFTMRKIKRGQNIEDYNRKMEEELEAKAKAKAKLVSDRIEETREQHYKMAEGIAKLSYAEILTARQQNAPFSTVRQNLASLESAMKVLKMAREERFAVLGVNEEKPLEDDELPELLVSELTPEQIEELRSKDTSEPEEDDQDVIGLTQLEVSE